MTLIQLEAFCTVVESGSFAGAAKRLGVQASAVSRRVAGLEADLGLTLLHRTTRKLTLSDAGREFFERSSQALEVLKDAQADLHQADAALIGTIRMSSPGAFGRRVLAPALVPFLSANPEVTVDLRVSDTLVDLVAEGIDLAIRAGGSTNSQHFVVRSLCRSPQRVYAAQSHIDKHGYPATLEDACYQPRIVRREAGQLLDLRLPNMPSPVLICDDVETVALAVQSGLGAALLPQWLAQSTPGLIEMPMHLDFPDGIYRAILPGGRRPPHRVRAMLDHLAQTLAGGLP